MKMSSLVDSTYRALVGRLQRGGTDVKPVSRPDASAYSWGFKVFSPGDKQAVYVTVNVGLLVRNVYKNDKVEIVVSDITGTVATHSFEPESGNCPSLDMVEAGIRTYLAQKQDLPDQPPAVVAAQAVSVVPPAEPEPAAEVPVESEHERRKDRSRRNRRSGRHDDAEPEIEQQTS